MKGEWDCIFFSDKRENSIPQSLLRLAVRFLVGGPFTEGPTVISATSSSSSQSSDMSHILKSDGSFDRFQGTFFSDSLSILFRSCRKSYHCFGKQLTHKKRAHQMARMPHGLIVLLKRQTEFCLT
jgi:hypothetical protein